MQTFRRVTAYKSHDCPATKRLARLDQIDDERQVAGPDRGLHHPLPRSFHIFTDGSGGANPGGPDVVAGWGVAVFDHAEPVMESQWTAALYGPVNVTRYDPIWLGALVHIHTGLPPHHPRHATIYYDSVYAYRAVTRSSKAKENTELIETVAALVTAVRRCFQLDFVHVRAHTGFMEMKLRIV